MNTKETRKFQEKQNIKKKGKKLKTHLFNL